MDFVTLGGNLFGTIPLGDIVLYLTPFICSELCIEL